MIKKEINIEKNLLHYSFMNSEVIFTKRFSKNDSLFKEFIIKKILISDSKKIILSENDFNKIIKLNKSESVSQFLSKFVSKRIEIKYQKSELNFYTLSLSIISSYIKNNNIYELNINSDFFKIFNTEKNDYKLFHLNTLLSFSNSYIRNLFLFIKTIYNGSAIEISLENLKKILDFDDKYPRFFDLEKSILIPALNEIKTFSGYEIKYSKIKRSISSNSKVIGIKLIILSTPEKIKAKNLEFLFNLISPYADNIKYLKNFIEEYYRIKSFEYLKNNIHYSILHNQNNFDKYTIEAIKYNYLESKYKRKLKLYSSKFQLITNLNIKIESFEKFKNRLFNEISNLNFSHTLLVVNSFKLLNSNNLKSKDNNIYNNFITDLNNFKNGYFEDSSIVILAEYNGIFFNSQISILIKTS